MVHPSICEGRGKVEQNDPAVSTTKLHSNLYFSFANAEVITSTASLDLKGYLSRLYTA